MGDLTDRVLVFLHEELLIGVDQQAVQEPGNALVNQHLTAVPHNATESSPHLHRGKDTYNVLTLTLPADITNNQCLCSML